MNLFNDIWIARLLASTACLAVLISVLVIGIRVALDGVGPEMGNLTDALIKIALGGGFFSGGTLLAGKAIEMNQTSKGNGNATSKPTE